MVTIVEIVLPFETYCVYVITDYITIHSVFEAMNVKD